MSSGSPFEREIGYSRAVVEGDWVCVAGTTGYDYATMTISGDVTYILPDRDDWPASWPITRQVFANVRRGSTTMMAGLQNPAMKIEITARLPRRARTRSDDDADEGAGAP